MMGRLASISHIRCIRDVAPRGNKGAGREARNEDWVAFFGQGKKDARTCSRSRALRPFGIDDNSCLVHSAQEAGMMGVADSDNQGGDVEGTDHPRSSRSAGHTAVTGR